MSNVAPVLNPPVRTLMGPGPSDIHPRVLQALAKGTVGHLDSPALFAYLGPICEQEHDSRGHLIDKPALFQRGAYRCQMIHPPP